MPRRPGQPFCRNDCRTWNLPVFGARSNRKRCRTFEPSHPQPLPPARLPTSAVPGFAVEWPGAARHLTANSEGSSRRLWPMVARRSSTLILSNWPTKVLCARRKPYHVTGKPSFSVRGLNVRFAMLWESIGVPVRLTKSGSSGAVNLPRPATYASSSSASSGVMGTFRAVSTRPV